MKTYAYGINRAILEMKLNGGRHVEIGEQSTRRLFTTPPFSRHPPTVRVSVEIVTIVYTKHKKMLTVAEVQTNKIIYYTNLRREYTILIFFSSSQIVHQSLMPEESSLILERDDGCVAKNNKIKTFRQMVFLSENHIKLLLLLL